ncbi:MAG: ParB N-terminal domain-containing protein [Rhodococcus sp. (in: high G+C Gram-positive bacteria)]|uniref:ParB/RepB/Spo0J family partition protein n=1 Tax=Rhodococcus sp. TaxID=1831 RepID=UPI003BAE85A5
MDGAKVAAVSDRYVESVAADGVPAAASASAAAAVAVVELGAEGVFLPNVAVEKLAPNPHNPRDRIGNLEDLSTIVDQQLQPGTAVTRGAWLRVYPDDVIEIGEAEYVVVNGCRRLAAARHYGRPGLDVVIRDSLAESRATVVTAAVLENLAREDLDVLEEAKAVELLVQSLPSAAAAARMLGRTGAWVSQRRALLNLSPELQEALRAGELGVREARSLARVPREEQVEAWIAELDRQENPKPDPEPAPEPEPSVKDEESEQNAPDPVDKIVRALKGTKADPETAVAALEEFFDPADLIRVGAMLGSSK